MKISEIEDSFGGFVDWYRKTIAETANSIDGLPP
jgi:hypothetical protein